MMRAADQNHLNGRNALLRLARLLVVLPLVACGISQRAMAASSCASPEVSVAEDLFEAWSVALKTQHPDRVTRLFATDGAFLGFASPVARAGYMPIRDYFLYFLQFEPRVRVTERHVEAGCNFLIDQGTYVWSLKSRSTGAVETREARYHFIYELSGGGWRISQFIDELAGQALVAGFAVPPPMAPRIAVVDAATGAAVAGFVKRSEPAPRPNGAAVKASAPVVATEDEAGPVLPAVKPKARTQKRAPAEPRPAEAFSYENLLRDGP